MTTNIIQVATLGKDSKLIGNEGDIINRDCEEYDNYQIFIKQYMFDRTKFHSNLEKYFSILL